MSKLDKLALGSILSQYKAGEMSKEDVYKALQDLDLMKEPKIVKASRITVAEYGPKTTLILGGK